MSVTKLIVVTAAIAAATTTIPAHAAGRTTTDDLATYLFLIFCALIIVAQVAPLLWQALRKRAHRGVKQETAEQIPKL